jgi:hypothetical protein
LLRIRSWWEISLIVGALGLWVLVLTCREKWRKHRTRGWPTTPGAVENIQVRKVDGGMNGVDYWKTSFDYTYQVQQQHHGSYSFNCTSEKMADGAIAGLKDKTVSVHYKPSDESKGIVWEDEVWNVWWDTYWN